MLWQTIGLGSWRGWHWSDAVLRSARPWCLRECTTVTTMQPWLVIGIWWAAEKASVLFWMADHTGWPECADLLTLQNFKEQKKHQTMVHSAEVCWRRFWDMMGWWRKRSIVVTSRSILWQTRRMSTTKECHTLRPMGHRNLWLSPLHGWGRCFASLGLLWAGPLLRICHVIAEPKKWIHPTWWKNWTLVVGSSSVTYNPSYVKQNVKKRLPLRNCGPVLPGQLLTDDVLKGHLIKLSEMPGWHLREGIVIHVCRGAKSLRTPEPRFKSEIYPLRSSYGRLDSTIQSEWRVLDQDVRYSGKDLNRDCADVLVPFCRRDVGGLDPQNKQTSWEILLVSRPVRHPISAIACCALDQRPQPFWLRVMAKL